MRKENRTTISQKFPLEVMEQYTDDQRPLVYSEPHWHELVEILMVEEGELLLQLGEKGITMQAGDVCLINQYGIHSTRSTKMPMRGHVIFFSPSLLINSKSMHDDERLIENSICGERCYYLPSSPSNSVREDIWALLTDIIKLAKEELPGYTLFIKANLMNLFAHLISDSSMFEEYPNPNQRLQRERLDKILMFLENNYANRITLNQIATSINVSPFRFCHIFRELTGSSFSRYLLQYRIAKAQEMLTYERKSITEIAMNCGFNNISYFNHIFKRTTGYTPGQFRRAVPERYASVSR